MYSQTLSPTIHEDLKFSPCRMCAIQQKLENLENEQPEGWITSQTMLRKVCPCDKATFYADSHHSRFMISTGDSIGAENIEPILDVVVDLANSLGFRTLREARNSHAFDGFDFFDDDNIWRSEDIVWGGYEIS